jgi:hypothetical protein
VVLNWSLLRSVMSCRMSHPAGGVSISSASVGGGMKFALPVLVFQILCHDRWF